MSEDKTKYLDDLKNMEGKKEGEFPEQGDDKYKTREMTLKEVTDRIELEKQKADAKEQPGMQEGKAAPPLDLPGEAAPAPPGEKGEKEDTGATADETVVMDTMTEKDLEDIPDEIALQTDEMKTVVMPDGQIPGFEDETAAHRPKSNLTQILAVVVVVLFAIMLYFMFKSKSGQTPEPAVTGEVTGGLADVQKGETAEPTETTETAGTGTAVKPADKEEAPPVYKLSDEIYHGEAPLTVKPGGAVFSEEQDPEIAAIADALKTRVKIIHGSKTNTRRDIKTTIINGSFQGFRVINTHQVKNNEVIRNETVVTTPRKSSVVTAGHILGSVKRTDYQKFLEDLTAAGLEVIKETLPEESIVRVQLRVINVSGKKVKPGFLIGTGSVGVIKLDMPVATMESELSKARLVLVPKKIDVGGKYYNTYKVLDNRDRPLFFVNEKDGKVWGIQVASNKFKTARGMGIGNSLAELRLYYLKNEQLEISATDKGAPFVSIAGEAGKFFLQGKGLNFGTQDYPDDLKISSILLGGSPYAE
ncbi:MAG: hypothetical protein GY950_12965 [bacterium]|nr:hypothetical protein [bacterium]